MRALYGFLSSGAVPSPRADACPEFGVPRAKQSLGATMMDDVVLARRDTLFL